MVYVSLTSTKHLTQSIRIPRLANIPPLYCDWLRAFNYEKSWLFELQRREGGWNEIYCSVQNAALFVDLLQNIFYSITKKLNVHKTMFCLSFVWNFIFYEAFFLLHQNKNECWNLEQLSPFINIFYFQKIIRNSNKMFLMYLYMYWEFEIFSLFSCNRKLWH